MREIKFKEELRKMLPKKKEILQPITSYRFGKNTAHGIYLYNQAIDECFTYLSGKLAGMEEVIENYFIELEKKQSSEQMKEVKEKGLWEADLKSATFDDLKKGITQVLQSYWCEQPQEADK